MTINRDLRRIRRLISSHPFNASRILHGCHYSEVYWEQENGATVLARIKRLYPTAIASRFFLGDTTRLHSLRSKSSRKALVAYASILQKVQGYPQLFLPKYVEIPRTGQYRIAVSIGL